MSASVGCVVNVEPTEVDETATTNETGWTTFHANTGELSGGYTIRGSSISGARATARVSGLIITGEQSNLGAESELQFVRNGNSLELALRYVGETSENLRFEALDVEVPVATDVEIDATNGSIGAIGLTGQVTASTSFGAINAETTGPVQLASSNGGITGSARGGTAHTSNGSIEMTWTGGEPLEVATANGRVEIRVPRGIGFDLDVATSNGGIEVRAGQTTIDDEYVGPINGGGPLLRIRTSNGSVSVHE